MVFEVMILGSSSATPGNGRNQTAQLVNVNQYLFLVDCGEGTQMQLMRYRVRLNRIGHIFISHLHGDHYLGLMGLLSSMHLQRRTEPLQLFAPAGLIDIISLQLKYSHTVFSYPIDFQEIDTTQVRVICEHENLTVETIPMIHSVPCCGFLFREKPKKNKVRKSALIDRLPVPLIIALKNGEDIEFEGEYYKNEDLTYPARKRRSYAFCSDTAYNEKVIPQVQGVDLLYHEATFTEEFAEQAAAKLHRTAYQAGLLAKKAEVGSLLLGHFSVRYKDLTPLLEEAKLIFANSHLAIEGETFKIEE